MAGDNRKPLQPTQAESGLVELFAARRISGDNLPSLCDEAFEAFQAKGLPSRREEAWKYTDLRSLMRDVKPLATPPEPAAKELARQAGLLKETGFRRIVFVGGYFAPELSDLQDVEEGLSIGSLSEALATQDSFAASHLGKIYPAEDSAFALNTAFMSEGVVVRVSPGATIERPLHFVFVANATQPATYFLRSLIVVEKGARATFIESFEGSDRCDYHVNVATEIVVGEEAQVERIKISREGDQALHVSTLVATLAQSARLNDFGLTIGGSLIRNQTFVKLAGQGAAANLRGANILAGKDRADSTLLLDHAVEGSESKAVFKSVLDDDSQAVFQGKIRVRPAAQHTDARMMARALLLSGAAQAICKPELEIFADDVQCGHGSTVGALDQELKFYLMARGIPEADAIGLLVEAFIGETLDGIEHSSVRDQMTSLVAARLNEPK